MNRTTALLSALLVTSAACGGKVVVDGLPDGTSTSTTGSSSGASTSSGAGGGGGSTSSSSTSSTSSTSGGGGCDAASHSIDLAGFNVSCALASDCASVFVGSYCDGCACPNSGINAADLAKYQAAAQAKQAGTTPSSCFCPADVTSCVQGKCMGSLP